ncbi:MAG: hypothetical protein COT34_01485 [Candidatus Nealsonbacteria bacterium CG08_land_8_20_14_0_20_43_11]|uniref:YdbS-like PH domain-containing protein n=1 Tax=Candidatus Nealsonbacteria bacterium CG08_land_8_20_14_0_20_43_11 TaxID=1974706 RepID=A0A2M6T136_9BACT|nr:MAG: hypothetical protein COT34_01485 [Candidatus Nealsonbacteria bacterium CG08_land_8_20_14_0_20_43_11]
MSIFTASTNSFRGKRTDETTVLVTRKHWILLLPMLVTLFILILLPFIVCALIEKEIWWHDFSSLYWFLVAVHFLVLWILSFYSITMYFLNTLVVTNKRVIENKQDGFFKYTMNEMELERIQDITVKVFGPLASFLDFGDIEIQSAGTTNKFYLSRFPHPKKIKETIMGLKI